MLLNLSLNIICSSKFTVFLEFRSLKTSHFGTDNFYGQIRAKRGLVFIQLSVLCITIISSANKCSLRVLVFESILLTFSLGPLSWNRQDVSLNAWSRFDQQLSEKTDVSSIQSNKTSRFRFSTKYLKLKVVLQIVCLLPVLLVPKLIFYISTNELLSVALQCCDASRIKESSVRSRDRRQSYVNHLLPKNQKHSSGWLSPAQQWNGCCKMQMLRQSSKTLQSLGLTLPRSH